MIIMSNNNYKNINDTTARSGNDVNVLNLTNIRIETGNGTLMHSPGLNSQRKKTSGMHNHDKTFCSIESDSYDFIESLPISLGGSVELCKLRKRKNTTSATPVLNRTSFVDTSKYSHDNTNGMIQKSHNRNKISNDTSKPFSFISTLINDFNWALNELGWVCMRNESCTTSAHDETTIDERKLQIEKWVMFVETSLTKGRRIFTKRTTSANATTNEILSISDRNLLEVTEAASPLQFLAAAFRNVVHPVTKQKRIEKYADVLTSEELLLTLEQQEILKDILEYIQVENNVWTVHLTQQIRNSTDLIVCYLYGFEPGCTLYSTDPVDVFLSTIIATRLLESALNSFQVTQLAALMCATANSLHSGETSNESYIERLYTRLVDCNRRFKISMDRDTIIETIQTGADLSNRLIGYAANPEINGLLNRVWRRMVRERNSDLFAQQADTLALYTLEDYCVALHALATLFSESREAVVAKKRYQFCSFYGVPTPAEINRWQQQCSTNLYIMSCYLQSRYVSVALVASFATLTGGGANTITNTYFMGDLNSIRNSNPPRIGDGIKLLPYDECETCPDFDRTVYEVLRGENGSCFDFDVQRAPLAAFLYKELGIKKISLILSSYEIPLNRASARALLEAIPSTVLDVVGKEFYTIAVTRQKATERLLKQILYQKFLTNQMYFM